MVTDQEYSVDGNGHNPEPENQEQLNAISVKLDEIKRGASPLLSFSKEQLSLMQAIFYASTEEFRELQFWRMCDFLDGEAQDHVDAFYEAKELGMDTSYNVAYAFALCSENRKGGFNRNLIAVLTDTLQNYKWATANNQKKGKIDANPRSPLSS